MSSRLAPGVHAARIWDEAKFLTGKGVDIPANPTPPYSPDLNPTEIIRHHLRNHYQSPRDDEDYEAMLEAAVEARRAACLAPRLIRSILAYPHFESRTEMTTSA